jgi:hypothetical protein
MIRVDISRYLFHLLGTLKQPVLVSSILLETCNWKRVR